MKPTTEAYTEIQQAYDTFNKRLFDNTLPDCLFTLQRIKSTFGYFASDKFINIDGKKTDEIALNPSYFPVIPLLEILQTLAHEMVHQWQKHHGKPGRSRYHNKEWAQKMESIGLMPSDTGQPGGKRTGDSMADYPIENGLFLKICEELLTNDFKITWHDRFPPQQAIKAGQNSFIHSLNLPNMPDRGITVPSENGIGIAETTNTENKSNRKKYTCTCAINIWGKPELNIICGDCGEPFTEQP